MGRGVACSKCGASTPLPEDLRAPTFQCGYCQERLATAAYASKSAVSADEMRGYLMGLVEHGTAGGPAPRFEQHNEETRPAPCLQCGAVLRVPLDLHVRTLECPSCKKVQPVAAYISNQDRFVGDMARQLQGNQALAKLRAEGAPCPKCGGSNAVPDDGSVQFVCKFCGGAILLSELVSADAIARSRLKHAMRDVRAAAVGAQKKRDRQILILVAVLLAVAGAAVAIGTAIGHR